MLFCDCKFYACIKVLHGCCDNAGVSVSQLHKSHQNTFNIIPACIQPQVLSSNIILHCTTE